MPHSLRWDTDGRDWPHRAASRFVEAGGLRWHVQQLGSGPVALLVHGTGASTHSWRELAAALAHRHHVVMMDLPGHAFTQSLPPGRATLPAVATGLATLLERLRLAPEIAIGHSAGAAILARMALDGRIHPQLLVSLNGALLPLPGLPGAVWLPMARMLAANSLAARLFAWRAADPAAVRRLVASTGSRLDDAGVDWYARLVRNRGHVMATLQMMASWDLEALQRDLPRLATPLLLLVGADDSTVPPSESERVASLVPRSRVLRLAGLGHLAHEERPLEVARRIEQSANDASVGGA